ncbi:hypothetical protein O9992_01085 [Vibrio lentus]|nr:hypothetical protein [Vibrio lentus]
MHPEDKDGDIVTSTVTHCADGAPPVIDTIPTVALEEANLVDGFLHRACEAKLKPLLYNRK